MTKPDQARCAYPFDGQGIAKAIIAFDQRLVTASITQVAVIPGRLCLRINVKAILAIPGQRSTKAIAIRADAAATGLGIIDRSRLSKAMGIMNADTADQLTIFILHQHAIDASMQLEDVLVVKTSVVERPVSM